MDAEINERVRAIITELGLTNRQFAECIGLQEDKLSKTLNGRRRFSPLELANIAELSGRSSDWLVTGAEPRNLGLAARADGVAMGDLHAPAAAIAQRYTNAQDVLVELGRARELPELPSIPTSGRFVTEGHAMAAWAGEHISAGELLAGTDEFMMLIQQRFGVDIASVDDMPHGCDGLSFQDESFRLILLATTSNWTRKRFTLAHELGHVLWRDAFHQILTEQVKPGQETDYNEKRANAFAAAFLMPESVVAERINDRELDEHTFHELVMAFKVSPSAMAARLSQLGHIERDTASSYRRFRAQDSAAAIDQALVAVRESTEARVPWGPDSMILAFLGAYREALVTTKPLVMLTGVSAAKWREIFAEESPQAVVTEDPHADDAQLAFQP
jgi:Zn-dependent peptidase ImmA (M78 family)/transcriptional regulator with XRE-family HTH domain